MEKEITMNDLHGDGSNHIACNDCGLCIECGDCKHYGCGAEVRGPAK